MNVIIDESTKQALLENLKKRNKSAVRLAIKGFGWGGPSFGVVLDEQREDDDEVEVEGIKFIAEKDISFVFANVKVVYRKGVFGDLFEIYDPDSSSGCCN